MNDMSSARRLHAAMALAIFGLLASAAFAAPAEQTLAQYDWAKLSAEGKLTAGQVVTDPQLGQVLKLSTTAERTFPLLVIDSPGITADVFDLRGQVRFDEVQGNGYLEMVITAEGQDPLWARTLAPAGAMGKITGTSEWRDLIVLKKLDPLTPRPTRLELRLVLQGAGTVYLSPLRLTQSTEPPGAEPTATFLSTDQVPPGLLDGQSRRTAATTQPAQEQGAAQAWWSNRQAGLIGGIGGSVVGLIGALVGTLAGMGKARRLVLGLVVAVMALGLAAAVAGIVAVVQDQPYAVFYPLLLGGGLAVAIFGGLLPIVLHRYRGQVASSRAG